MVDRKRCSSVPRGIKCPASWQETGVVFDPENPMAQLGTAVHEALAAHVEGLEPDLSAIAERHSTDLSEVERLYEVGKQLWGEINVEG